MASAYFNMKNDLDKHDVKKLKRHLDEFKGVSSVTYSGHNQNIAVDFSDRDVDFLKIKKKIENLGYNISYTKCDMNLK